MSNRLVKERAPLIDLPNDSVVGSIVLHKSGRVSINFPSTHPREVCKLLAGLQYDLMFGSFQMAEISPIVKPATANGVAHEEQETSQ